MIESIDAALFSSLDEDIARTCEEQRFLLIAGQLDEAKGEKRHKLKNVVFQYLQFSPNADYLITEFISACLQMKSPDRLDFAIDVLSRTGRQIVLYAQKYLEQDIASWSKLNPNKKFQPNDDYWYVLLRSIAKCKVAKKEALQIISACQDEGSFGVGEGVVEALGDIGTVESKRLLESISKAHPVLRVKELAREVLLDQ